MSIVLYASDVQLTENHVPVEVRGFRDNRVVTVYVRAELDEDSWPGQAIRKAKPNAREIPLNALPNAVISAPVQE